MCHRRSAERPVATGKGLGKTLEPEGIRVWLPALESSLKVRTQADTVEGAREKACKILRC